MGKPSEILSLAARMDTVYNSVKDRRDVYTNFMITLISAENKEHMVRWKL